MDNEGRQVSLKWKKEREKPSVLHPPENWTTSAQAAFALENKRRDNYKESTLCSMLTALRLERIIDK